MCFDWSADLLLSMLQTYSNSFQNSCLTACVVIILDSASQNNKEQQKRSQLPQIDDKNDACMLPGAVF